MSILIKGMEMQKSCGDCPCLSETYCCCVDGVYPYDCNILIQETKEGSEFIGRLSNCPLVEVPTPHGRLIDAEALQLEAYNRLFDRHADDRDVAFVNFLLGKAPTIIESEGK